MIMGIRIFGLSEKVLAYLGRQSKQTILAKVKGCRTLVMIFGDVGGAALLGEVWRWQQALRVKPPTCSLLFLLCVCGLQHEHSVLIMPLCLSPADATLPI